MTQIAHREIVENLATAIDQYQESPGEDALELVEVAAMSFLLCTQSGFCYPIANAVYYDHDAFRGSRLAKWDPPRPAAAPTLGAVLRASLAGALTRLAARVASGGGRR